MNAVNTVNTINTIRTSETKRCEIIHDIPTHWSREKKIEQLLSIARTLSKKWRVRPDYTSMEQVDIYSVAAIAIVRAVDDYNPSREVKLTTYAMCKAEWAVKEAYRKYSHASRKQAEQGEIVQWILFSTARYRRANEETTLGDYIERTLADPYTDLTMDYLQEERQKRVKAYLERLPSRERQVIESHIYNGDTYMTIGKAMGISQARVYQLSQRALKLMKGYFEADEQLPSGQEKEAGDDRVWDAAGGAQSCH